VYQLKLSSLPDNPIALAREEFIIESIALGKVTLLGIMAEEFDRTNREASRVQTSPVDFGSTLDSSELYQAVPSLLSQSITARRLSRGISEKLEGLPSNSVSDFLLLT